MRYRVSTNYLHSSASFEIESTYRANTLVQKKAGEDSADIVVPPRPFCYTTLRHVRLGCANRRPGDNQERDQ